MAKATKKAVTPKKKSSNTPLPEYTSEVNEIIRTRIKDVRKMSGLTQEGFAEKLNSNIPYVKALEQGRFTPSTVFLVSLAQTFKVDLNWLFGLNA